MSAVRLTGCVTLCTAGLLSTVSRLYRRRMQLRELSYLRTTGMCASAESLVGEVVHPHVPRGREVLLLVDPGFDPPLPTRGLAATGSCGLRIQKLAQGSACTSQQVEMRPRWVLDGRVVGMKCTKYLRYLSHGDVGPVGGKVRLSKLHGNFDGHKEGTSPFRG